MSRHFRPCVVGRGRHFQAFPPLRYGLAVVVLLYEYVSGLAFLVERVDVVKAVVNGVSLGLRVLGYGLVVFLFGLFYARRVVYQEVFMVYGVAAAGCLFRYFVEFLGLLHVAEVAVCRYDVCQVFVP